MGRLKPKALREDLGSCCSQPDCAVRKRTQPCGAANPGCRQDCLPHFKPAPATYPCPWRCRSKRSTSTKLSSATLDRRIRIFEVPNWHLQRRPRRPVLPALCLHRARRGHALIWPPTRSWSAKSNRSKPPKNNRPAPGQTVHIRIAPFANGHNHQPRRAKRGPGYQKYNTSGRTCPLASRQGPHSI